MEYISTSALANELEIKSAELFDQFKTMGWIEKKNDKWILTETGKKQGGQTRFSHKTGEFIVWPQNINLNGNGKAGKSKLLNATAIGKYFNVSSQRLNLILNDLGWIEKSIAGWDLTKIGKLMGGKQYEHETSGGVYVLWPEGVLGNKDLQEIFHVKPKEYSKNEDKIVVVEEPVSDFRKKFPAEYRTKDGHYVRSKAEQIIDDSLYLWGLPHAYEKKLPNTEHNVYSDFHIPSGNGRPKAVYIEYWGLENDPQYNDRKNKKINVYNELGLTLIQLNDADIKNIEDNLQKYLLKNNIKITS